MSVSSVTLIDGPEYHFGLKTDASVRATFKIITSTTQGGVATKTQAQAWSPTGSTPPEYSLPVRYETLALLGDTDNSVVVTAIDMKMQPKRTQWHATVTWSPLPPGHLLTDGGIIPTSRPANYWFEFQTESEVIEKAYNVNLIDSDAGARAAGTLGPIETAARVPFSDPLFEDRHRQILVVQKNYSSGLAAATLIGTYDQTINKGPLFGGAIATHCARFDSAVSSPPRYENGYTYWEVTIRIALSSNPFYRSVVNKGLHYWDGSNVVRITKTNDAGLEVDEVTPQLLDTDGTLLADGSLGNTIDYRTLEQADYGPLEALIYP